MNKYKLINFVLLTVSLLATVSMWVYLELVCKTGNCSYDLRNIYLRPFLQVGVFLSPVLGVLILLPSHYFEKWLKWIFTWMFPLYLILIYKLGDDSGQIISFPYALVAQFLGIAFGVITLIFVLGRFVFTHKSKHKKTK